MSDDKDKDLIRRGDAKAMANKHGFLASEDLDKVTPADLSALIAEAREQGARMALEMAEAACLEERGEMPVFFDGGYEPGHSDGAQDCFDAIRALAADPAFRAKVRARG